MAPQEATTTQNGSASDSKQETDQEALPGKRYPQRYLRPLPPGEEVVISGIAGKFPECENMKELKESLMAGKDLLTSDESRYDLETTDIPPRSGKIHGLEKFDASFFSCHYKQAQTLDPMHRLLLERVFEAIIDAGVNPRSLRDTRMGVYVGACFSESEKKWMYERSHLTDHGITGCARSMLSNRISYWLGVKGPSYCLDTACSSSLYAFNEAYEALRNGSIDSAIVGGTNLLLHPTLTLQFVRLGVLSPRAIDQPFDEGADGYVRAEAVGCVFLQRAKDARRIYATVVNSGANCDGFKEQGITFPSYHAQAELMRETWGLAGLHPGDVGYIEAHATATRVGDPEEMTAIDSVFCQESGRKQPLLVGSVKSNLGHCEPASGISSLAKVIIAMEEGIIPPTINYKTPRRELGGIIEGRIKVVAKPTPWNGGLVAVNSFGFGGANAHVILRSLPDCERVRECSLPRLVFASGRTQDGVNLMLAEVERHDPPHEGLVNLMHSIHEENIPGHVYRGFVVAGAPAEAKGQLKDIQYWSGEKRPVWYVFSGMGSQWPKMGSSLMQLPIFVAAVQRCHAVLQPRGLDIVKIITSNDPKTFDNILNCFVGIATIQIGLVDILNEVGIEPDFLIGHSVGELGCAYADGCLSAEQTVLAAYSRGRASLEAKLIPGAMAAVGISAAQVSELCPPDIDVACHNSPESSTISGPVKSLRAFVETLKAKGIFAKEVQSANIAYHSRYIKPAGDLLIKYLKEVIPNPLPRSKRWLSSSVPESAWDSEAARLCSAEYQTQNLLSCVRFESVLTHIPPDAITIEIAPHGLLQAILKRALPNDVINVPLTKRGADSLTHVLAALGRLYNAGLQPRPAALYPPPQWPVPRGTPMLSPLIGWAHEEDWFVAYFKTMSIRGKAEREFVFAAQDDETRLWQGHVIDGRPLVPATAYLKMVWDALATMKNRNYTNVPVVIEDAKFLRATHLPTIEGDTLKLSVILHRASGDWEVSDGGTVVATGKIRILEDPAEEFSAQNLLEPRAARPAPDDADVNEDQGPAVTPAVGEQAPDFDLSSKHVYKCLRLRGYNYKGDFRGIESASPDGQYARVAVKEWVPFLDTMLQMRILTDESSNLVVPTSIQKIVIDPVKFTTTANSLPGEKKAMDCHVLPYLDTIATTGIEIQGLVATPITRRRVLADPVLEHSDFVPYDALAAEERDAAQVARVCVQLALENRPPVTRSTPAVRVAELLGAGRRPVTPLIVAALEDTPLVQSKGTVFVAPGIDLEVESLGKVTQEEIKKFLDEKNVDITILNYPTVADVAERLTPAVASMAKLGALLVSLPSNSTENAAKSLKETAAVSGLLLVSTSRTLQGDLIFQYKKGGWEIDPKQVKVVRVPELAAENVETAKAFSWLAQLKEALKDPNLAEKRVVLVARGRLNGVLGFFNCLRAEPGAASQLVRLYLLPEEADKENVSLDMFDAPGFRERLHLDLAVNILQGGKWGSMRHLKFPSELSLPMQYAYADTAVTGDLGSFKWFQARINTKRSPSKDQKLVHVHYASLNFKDVMVATRKLIAKVSKESNSDTNIGLEFSGRLENGKRVMGLKTGGAICTALYAYSDMLWDVPDHLTLQEAATIPVAYSTVITALDLVGHMQPGESVLIHAASGAVGQAAIVLALSRGCRVFATVGTQEKRDFLLSTFPQLDAEDIGSSRDVSFEKMVMRRTGGKGVDIVLNSLAESKLQASLRCLGTKGRFLEIGKVDMMNNSEFGMGILLKEASVHGILLDTMMNRLGSSELLEMRNRLTELLQAGVIQPIRSVDSSHQVFSKDQVEEAFRFMGAGKHIGKVLIAIREGEPELGTIKSKPVTVPACPRLYCDPEESYVISGGLGGLGLELAHWLVERGARKLVLVSRRGVATGYQARRLLQWRESGVRTLVRTDDLATKQGAEALLRAAEAFAPVAAIFNLAVVLRDGMFNNQTPESFRESFRCKASATVNLDIASRRLCPRLRHFVLFSSVACGRGNAGQTNYGLSNSVMERVARARRAAGLPATAVQWGAVGDVGLVADMRDDDKLLEIGGTLQQKLSSLLEALDGFTAKEYPVVSSMVVAEKTAGSGDDLATAVAALLGFRDLKSVSHESSLAELGMDSMISVEIQQMLGRDFDVLVTTKEVRALTFARLKEIQREKLSKKSQTTSTAPKNTDSSAATNVPFLGKEGLEVLCKEIHEQQVSPRLLVEMGLSNDAKVPKKVVVLFPGVEGVAAPLEALCNGLQRPVAALQLPFDNVQPSIQGIAHHLMPHVHESVARNAGAGFALVGYSFGGLLALEAAAQLESNKKNSGHVVLLDSSPDYVHTMLTQLTEMTIPDGENETVQEKLFQARLQERLLIHMILLVSPNKSLQDIQESVLKEMGKDWESLLEIFANLSTEVKYPSDVKMRAIDAFYKRLLVASQYHWPKERPKLRSTVTLIRPKASSIPSEELPEDYGLSEICERPVRVLYVQDADHYTLLNLPTTISHINSALEGEKDV